MRNILILLIFLTFNKLISQEIIEKKEVYINNNLAYKVADNGLFTGIIQVKRKNGHLVYEEEFKNGNLTYSCQYLGKKKHGLELSYKDGEEKITFRCEYINGKKHGIEYCLKENGTESKKEFYNEKKMK
jgi:antitoxin component YwqK of YwqJK toxin-antitoxin module